MSDSDTVKLLRECNSGIQMAVFSIDEILEKVTDKNSVTKPTRSLLNAGMKQRSQTCWQKACHG